MQVNSVWASFFSFRYCCGGRKLQQETNPLEVEPLCRLTVFSGGALKSILVKHSTGIQIVGKSVFDWLHSKAKNNGQDPFYYDLEYGRLSQQ